MFEHFLFLFKRPLTRVFYCKKNRKLHGDTHWIMKLSIITINRNNAGGLRKTIESVVSQTFKDFEYIVIDGASTDNSVDVIKASQTEGLNFMWISEPDGGVYEAMNKGIKRAKGEYCLFLNSGDYLIAPDVLEHVFAQNTSADIINARCDVSDNEKVVWKSPYLPKVTLKDLYFVGLPHQSTFIRRALFEQYGLYREDFRYNSDIDFWYKAIILGDATTYGVDVIVADYNLDGLSTLNAESEEYKREMDEILSQGFLAKVLPDYDQWMKERNVLDKYIWIEEHRCLQKVLNIYRKINKRLSK